MKGSVKVIFFGWIIAACLLNSGCETSLDLPVHNLSRLTIISHLASEGWERQRVFVYASQSPSDSSAFLTPTGLEVDVTEEDSDLTIRLDSVREEGRLFFIFPQGFIKQGHTYTIAAYAPGFESVRARTYIPLPSSVSNLVIRDVKIQPSEKHEFKNIVRYKLEFDIDHAIGNRYYHLVFYNEYAGLDNLLMILDPEPSDDQPFLHHYDFGVLLDKEDLAPGSPLTFSFVDWVVENNDLKRVYVELRSITEEYYRYHSTLARQLIVRQDPFAEPVSIFNNIEGGYGNFSGFTPAISSSDLPH